jgi:hypothetical protein
MSILQAVSKNYALLDFKQSLAGRVPKNSNQIKSSRVELDLIWCVLCFSKFNLRFNEEKFCVGSTIRLITFHHEIEFLTASVNI